MTEARIKSWTTKPGRKTATKVPKLCSLPPTSEVFEENVKRVHFQCAIWRRALQEPPNVDPTKYGWFKDEQTKSLQPVTLPPLKLSAPDYIIKLVCCSCASERPCHSNNKLMIIYHINHIIISSITYNIKWCCLCSLRATFSFQNG